MESMWGLLEIPRYLMGGSFAVSVWTFVTIALSALLFLFWCVVFIGCGVLWRRSLEQFPSQNSNRSLI